MILGLVGKICSGKDEAIKCFSNYGYKELNVDLIGHKALEMKKDELVSIFSSSILTQGLVDRKKLSKIVFSSEDRLATLNNIVHPWMVEEVKKSLTDKTIINAALLYKMGLDKLCDKIIYVYAPYGERLERAKKRSNMDRNDFILRDNSQKDLDSSLFSGKKSVITLINNKTIDNLYRQITFLCVKLDSEGKKE